MIGVNEGVQLPKWSVFSGGCENKEARKVGELLFKN